MSSCRRERRPCLRADIGEWAVSVLCWYRHNAAKCKCIHHALVFLLLPRLHCSILASGLRSSFLPPLAAVSKVASLAAVIALLVPSSTLLGPSLPGGATVGLPTTEITFRCGWWVGGCAGLVLVLVTLEGGATDCCYGGGTFPS